MKLGPGQDVHGRDGHDGCGLSETGGHGPDGVSSFWTSGVGLSSAQSRARFFEARENNSFAYKLMLMTNFH